MARHIPFEFEVPVSFFEKANAPKGQQRRVGGIISTELPDMQGETVLASGLDLNYFKTNGWLNDNHAKGMGGVVGYPDPDGVKQFKKGETLPNGEAAKANGIWSEGYILNNKSGNDVWELAESLKDTGRQLGYSVEGKVTRRAGPKTIARKLPDGTTTMLGSRVVNAIVRNVAITHCPVNDSTGLEILAKSMLAAKLADPDDVEIRLDRLEKALTVGTPTTPGVAPVGPVTGEGAGQILSPESLDQDRPPKKKKKKKKSRLVIEDFKKSLSYNEAVDFVMQSRPHLDRDTALRIVNVTQTLKRKNRL